MTARNYSNTGSDATIAALLGAGDLAVSLGNYAGFPPHPYIAVIDPDTVDEEIVLVTNVVGSTVTMTRGYDGTTAKSHSAGAVFRHVAAAKDFQEANDHVNATSGVHGVSGALVGATSTQTLTNKTLTTPVLSAPTVTGLLSGSTAAFSGSVSTGDLLAADVTADSLVTVSGAFSGAVTIATTLGVTGALTGSTASFSGLVTASTAPTAGGHLVNKTYADALGTAAATASTIVRRDSNADTAFRQVTASQDPSTANALTRKSWVDSEIDTAIAAVITPKVYYDTGTGSGNITTSISAPADGASITLPAGKYAVDYECYYALSVSSPRHFDLHLWNGTASIDSVGFDVTDTAINNSRTFNSFAVVTLTSTKTLSVRTGANATGGTQFMGPNKIRAIRVE